MPPDGSDDRRYPYLYVESVNMAVNAKFVLKAGSPQPPPGQNVRLKGVGSDGAIFGPITTAAGAQINTGTLTSNIALPAAVTYWSGYGIVWSISCDNGATWDIIATTRHIVYVCLDGSQPAQKFRTVVHLACFSPGATTRDAAVLKTWSLLQGLTFKGFHAPTETWDRKLYYYKPGTSIQTSDNPNGGAAQLLQSPTDSGQCSTWAGLMRDALRLNGASTLDVTIRALAPHDGFLIKDWTFGTPTSGNPSYPYTFIFPGADWDMTPVPAGDVYGDLTSQNTLAGQNSSPPPRAPSQKVFENHQILAYTDTAMPPKKTYYDPSYGQTYTDVFDFQGKALAGLAKDLHTSPQETLNVKKPTTLPVNEVSFTEV